MTARTYRKAASPPGLVAIVSTALVAALLVLAMSMALMGIQRVSRPGLAPPTPEPGPEIPAALGLFQDAALTGG
jgi:hypothetical protein